MAGTKIDVELLNSEEIERELLTAIFTAQTKSVGAATRRLEKDLEAQTRAATKGNAWRAWKSEVFPRGGKPARNPVGQVRANGGPRSKGMLSFWSLPGTNRAKGNPFLAVPLRAALGTSLGRHISPRQWEIRFRAKLRPLFRSGKTPLLVADGAVGAAGFVPAKPTRRRFAGDVAAKKRGGQSFRREGTVAVFALIDEQPHANKVSIGSALGRAQDFMIADFARRVNRLA